MKDYSELELLPAQELIRWAVDTYGESLAVATSFQASGSVILDMVARVSTSVRVITLDTGRLPEETYRMMETVRSRYGFPVEVVFPDPVEVEAMVRQYGPNLFYQDASLRQLCCEIRKVRPLERKLKEFRAWINGARRSQSGARSGLRKLEENDDLLKLTPLVDWTGDQVQEYIQQHDLPQHPLYAEGYTSIGCAPCTRPTLEGEDERAGRWWWEAEALKECGIHFAPAGKARRSLDVPLEQILRGAYA